MSKVVSAFEPADEIKATEQYFFCGTVACEQSLYLVNLVPRAFSPPSWGKGPGNRRLPFGHPRSVVLRAASAVNCGRIGAREGPNGKTARRLGPLFIMLYKVVLSFYSVHG